MPTLPSLIQLRQSLRAGEFTPREWLERLDGHIAARDGFLGTYLSRDLPAALAAAETADLSLPLGGIPLGIKDNIQVRGQPCTCGSKFLESGATSVYDATVVARLRAAGAIPFGKLNMDEFGMGGSGEHSAFHPVRNPIDPERIPGGSSGGSAAAVAAGLAVAALGSDTGGSVRQPASHCGVVGVKPSYGRVSRYGLTAFASSLDQIGPLTRTVEDAAVILNAIAGADAADSTCSRVGVPDFLTGLEDGVKGLKLGLPKEYFGEGVQAGVKDALLRVVNRLAGEGAEMVEISLPHADLAVAAYQVISCAEASSNLARFDAIRYGIRQEAATVDELFRRSRSRGFGREVKRRLILGTFVLSAGHQDAYYGRAQKVRRLIQSDFHHAFEQVSAILTPVSPVPARRLGTPPASPLEEYLADVFTVSANLAGCCAMSVPAGVADTPDGGKALPVGLQIMCPRFAESLMLRIGRAAEAVGYECHPPGCRQS